MQINNKSGVRIIVFLCYLILRLICVQTQQFPTALTIKKDLEDFHDKDEAHVSDQSDEPEDLEVFHPTSQWQTLKPGQAVPAGSHVRLNLQTGHREVKLGEEEHLKYWTDGKRSGMMNVNTPSFTAQELKEALKKFKEGAEDPSTKNSEQFEDSVKSRFRSVDELKKDMEALDLLMETDVQIMRRLLTQFNSTNSTVEQRVTALLDLEYLVHQVDNGHNLVQMGGLKLVTDALNSSDVKVQENAAFVLGSAVSSNPSVQVEALESGSLHKLLTLLATPRPMIVKKKVLFALAALLRHFPFAQSHFVKHGGVQVLGELFQEHGSSALRVRIVTLLYDMVTEKELISGDNTEIYSDLALLPLLAERGWCRLVAELLDGPEHDQREKALKALLVMMSHCQSEYQQNTALRASLSQLQQEYHPLVLTEREQPAEDQYFSQILTMLDTLLGQIHQDNKET